MSFYANKNLHQTLECKAFFDRLKKRNAPTLSHALKVKLNEAKLARDKKLVLLYKAKIFKLYEKDVQIALENLKKGFCRSYFSKRVLKELVSTVPLQDNAEAQMFGFTFKHDHEHQLSPESKLKLDECLTRVDDLTTKMSTAATSLSTGLGEVKSAIISMCGESSFPIVEKIIGLIIALWACFGQDLQTKVAILTAWAFAAGLASRLVESIANLATQFYSWAENKFVEYKRIYVTKFSDEIIAPGVLYIKKTIYQVKNKFLRKCKSLSNDGKVVDLQELLSEGGRVEPLSYANGLLKKIDWKELPNEFRRLLSAESQADETEGVCNVYTDFLKTIGHSLGFVDEKTAKADEARARRFSVHSRSITDAKSLISLIKEEIFNTLRFFGVVMEDEATKLVQEIDYWMNRVAAMAPKDVIKGIYTDKALKETCRELIVEGHVLRTKLCAYRLPPNVNQNFAHAFTGLEKFHRFLVNKDRQDTGRIKAILVGFIGKPGQGKSVLLSELIHAVYAELGEKITNQDDIYPWNASAKYFSGYHGQKVLVGDDLFQRRDEELNSAAAEAIVHFVGDTPYQMEMADVDEKAGTFFTSELVGLTDNNFVFPNTVKITDLDALYRRFSVRLQVQADKKYCSMKILRNREHWILDPKKMNGRRTFECVRCFDESGTEWTWEQIVKKVATDLKESRETGSVYKAMEGSFKPFGFFKQAPISDSYEMEEEEIFEPEVFSIDNLNKMPIGQPVLAQDDDTKTELAKLNSALKKTVAKNRSVIQEWWSKVKEVLSSPRVKTVLAVTGAISVLGVGLYLWQAPKKAVSQDHGYENIGKPGVKASKPVVKVPLGKAFNLSELYSNSIVKAQGGEDEEEEVLIDNRTSEFIKNAVALNLATIYWHNGEYRTKRMLAFFTKARSCFVPSHFFLSKPEGYDYISFQSIGTPSVLVKVTDITAESVGNDMFQLTVTSNKLKMYKNLQDQIATSAELGSGVKQIALVSISSEGAEVRVGNCKLRRSPLQYTQDQSKRVMVIDEHFVYDIPTKAGDCGSVVISLDSSWNKKIIGMHVAGNGYQGFGHLFGTPNSQGARVALPDTVIDLGSVPPSEASRLPNATKIRQSPLYKGIQKKFYPEGMVKSPAILSYDKEKGISPVQNALNKTAVVKTPLTKEQRDVLEACVLPIVQRIPGPVRKVEVLDDDQLLNEVEGLKYIQRIHPETSSGYVPELPSSSKRPGKWSHIYCDSCASDEDLYPVCKKRDQTVCDDFKHKFKLMPEIQQVYDHIVSEMEEGNYDSFLLLFKDCVKDELRDSAKIHTPRLFSASHLILLLITRAYTIDFKNAMCSDPVNGISGVGINPHSREWKQLWERFHRFKELCRQLPGDFSKYDASIIAEMADTVYKIVELWYKMHAPHLGQKFYNVLKGIWLHTYFGVHIIFDLLYCAPGSNPSGAFLTTEFNVLSNLIAHMFAFYCEGTINRKLKLEVADYFDFCEFQAFGDDHMEATCCMWHTLKTKAYWFKVLSMTYTSTSKGAIEHDYVPDEDVTYLKRHFKPVFGEVFAPLDVNSIYTAPAYYKEGKTDVSEIMKQTLQNCELEAFQHGKEFLEKWILDLTKISKDAGFDVYPPARPWASYYNEYCEDKLVVEADAQGGKAIIDKSAKPIPNEIKYLTYVPKVGGYKVVSLSANGYVEISFVPISELAVKAQGVEDTHPNNIDEVKDSITNEQNQLTAFSDVQPPIEELSNEFNSKLSYLDTNPYEKVKVLEVLRREFKFTEFQMTDADIQGTLLATINPASFYRTATVGFLQNIVFAHKFFKGRIKLTFKVNAPQQNFGTLLFSWLPRYKPTTTMGRFADIFQMSGNNAHIMSINTRNTVSFTIPWVNEYNWEDTNPVDFDYCLGHLRVVVLNTLGSLDSTPLPAIIQGFMCLEEVELSGPIAQSDGNTKEATQVSNKGTISTVFEKASGVASMFSNAGVFTSQTRFAASALKVLSGVARTLGYSKPHTLNSEQRFVPHPCQNLALGVGEDISSKLALASENHISTVSANFGTRDYDKIDELKLRPTLVYSTSIDATTALNAPIYSHRINPSWCWYTVGTGTITYHPTHLSNIASMHKFWTGGIKVMMLIETSKFTTGRIAVCYFPPGVFPPATLGSMGNHIAKIVDYTGATVHDLTLPYLSDKPWLPVLLPEDNSGTHSAGTFALYNLTPPTVPNASSDSTVYINLFVSGAEDIRFSRVTETYLRTPIEAQGSVEDEDSPYHLITHFQRQFEGLITATAKVHDKVVMGEQSGRMSEILSRYTTFGTFNQEILAGVRSVARDFEIFPSILTGNTAGFIDVMSFTARQIILTYQMHRGSFRFKVIPQYVIEGEPSDSLIARNYDGENFTGQVSDYADGAIVANDNKKILEFEIPYYSRYLFDTPYFLRVQRSQRGFSLLFFKDGAESVKSTAAYTIVFAAGNDYSQGWPGGIHPYTRNTGAGAVASPSNADEIVAQVGEDLLEADVADIVMEDIAALEREEKEANAEFVKLYQSLPAELQLRIRLFALKLSERSNWIAFHAWRCISKHLSNRTAEEWSFMYVNPILGLKEDQAAIEKTSMYQRAKALTGADGWNVYRPSHSYWKLIDHKPCYFGL